MSGIDGNESLPADTEKEQRDKDTTGESLRRLIPDWVRTGVMIKGITLDPAGTWYKGVQHGLKRKPVGWVVMSLSSLDGEPSGQGNVFVSTCDSSKITVCGQGLAHAARFDLWVW